MSEQPAHWRRPNRQSFDERRQAAAVGAAIALQLEEVEVEQLVRLVRMIGPDRARALADEALAIQANGGMLTDKGDRRRTTGGILFGLLQRGHVLRGWQWRYMQKGALKQRDPIVWRRRPNQRAGSR